MSLKKAAALVESIEDLPTLPECVIGITHLVDDPDATAEDIYEMVSTDPALSATMLKLVNSAFYGMSRSVTSLEQAIRILGFVTVRNIALAAFVFDAFVTGKGQFDYKGFWMHSIGAGAAAKVLAERRRLKESGEYFVYGLLHDLGIIVLMQYRADEYRRVVDFTAAGGDLAKAETEVLGCTHNEVGAALAERWDFPAPLIAVIAGHGSGGGGGEYPREAAMTTCASAVAQALEIGNTFTPLIGAVDAATWEAAGVRSERLGAVMDAVLAEMENFRSFVNLLFT